MQRQDLILPDVQVLKWELTSFKSHRLSLWIERAFREVASMCTHQKKKKHTQRDYGWKYWSEFCSTFRGWAEENWKQSKLTTRIRHLSSWTTIWYVHLWASQVAPGVKNPPANAGDAWEMEIRPLGQEGSPGGGPSNPLQYSCLENPIDRGAWQATVHGVAKSWTWLKLLSIHSTHIHLCWQFYWLKAKSKQKRRTATPKSSQRLTVYCEGICWPYF